MDKTAVVDTPVKEDRYKLDTLPMGEAVRVIKGDDGAVSITREMDGANWDGAVFVVPEPEPQRYVVNVIVEAIDDPTARAMVADALTAAKVTAEVAPLAELIADERRVDAT